MNVVLKGVYISLTNFPDDSLQCVLSITATIDSVHYVSPSCDTDDPPYSNYSSLSE